MNKLCNNLKAMFKCFVFILSILICMSLPAHTANTRYGSHTKSLNKLSSSDIEQLINFLVQKQAKKSQPPLQPKFIETETNERGMGCEAMNKCSGKGTCKSGSCVCDEGFDYFDCSISTNTSKFKRLIFKEKCPNNCSFHGECVDGKCICDPGWFGEDCSQQKCKDNCNGHGNCIVI